MTKRYGNSNTKKYGGSNTGYTGKKKSGKRGNKRGDTSPLDLNADDLKKLLAEIQEEQQELYGGLNAQASTNYAPGTNELGSYGAAMQATPWDRYRAFFEGGATNSYAQEGKPMEFDLTPQGNPGAYAGGLEGKMPSAMPGYDPNAQQTSEAIQVTYRGPDGTTYNISATSPQGNGQDLARNVTDTLYGLLKGYDKGGKSKGSKGYK
ncbi:hypothetical protein HOK51_00665 [Candidatus Woesearchaeota archaeon]|jgi:hypothetical protein|nr:hypothetical protein [Candidatus Woesearchaeota archaeon]MBT6518326.1 hypothetical protein [Candidatus Woesearchaeota archaeon]MBT7366623.1 hypothetical protein [Candidatus Woesearchaeota archaeon]